jgi:uncharacterized protein DUF4249
MKNHRAIFLLCLSLTACRQVYEPPAVSHPPGYLVVEGFIENNGSDSTWLTLSRTVKLDSSTLVPENDAGVTIEGSDNTSFPLPQVASGRYGSALAALNGNTTYRVRITTTSGKEYTSDYVPLVRNPPIDSISWVRHDDPAHAGIQIYANTHDPLNNTHYYRWSYDECWQFHSTFESHYNYVPGQGVIELLDPNDFTCWKYNSSSNILLGTSSQLAQDVIYEAPVNLIPLNSQQIMVRYSILVRQYALTKDAFTWWQTMQKNTEQIGSIFGVQPSANPGNIHCLSDPSEQVLGYISGGNSRAQRIFITNDQVLPWAYSSGCVEWTTNKQTAESLWNLGYLVYYIEITSGIIHYSWKTCIDCTLTGTNVRPSFW